MSLDFGSLNKGQVVLLIAYLIGQGCVAVVAPLLSYFLTRPHLKRVEAKAELVAEKITEVAEQTNGVAEKQTRQARADGYADGVANQKLPGPNPGPEGDRP